jgi:hypothetical protein
MLMISAMLIATVLLLRLGQQSHTPTQVNAPAPTLPAPRPAAVTRQAALGSNTVMMTARTAIDEESLLVLDQDHERLYFYRMELHGASGRIELADVIQLKELFDSDITGQEKPVLPTRRDR